MTKEKVKETKQINAAPYLLFLGNFISPYEFYSRAFD
jgi:hypothetical protein